MSNFYQNHFKCLTIDFHLVIFGVSNAKRYYDTFFRKQGDRKIWEGFRINWLPLALQEAARRKLRMLNSAQSLLDLQVPPSNRLEKLKGDLREYHSVRVNDQWRIIFIWESGNAEKVTLIDYH